MTHKHAVHRPVARRALACLPGLALWVSGTVALADDTEILTGQTLPYKAPNILFVIDTSGSMAGQVLVDDDYDPTITYPGPFANQTRLYYTLVDSSGALTYPDPSFLDFGGWVSDRAFVCDSAQTALNETGVFVDRFIQFDTQDFFWGFLEAATDNPATSGSDRFTECFKDYGQHGDNDNSGPFPINGDNPVPYATDPDDPAAFNWATYGLNYAFFSNNYLNWLDSREVAGDPALESRLEVVQGVTRNLIDRISVDVDDPRQAFNVGLMRFSTNAQGGMVLQPVDNVAESRDQIIAAVDSMSPSNNTPLSETLYEAYQYLRGAPIDFGQSSTPTVSVDSARDVPGGDNYVSPIEAACQRNYVVLLTDGLPTSDSDANERIASVIGEPCVGNCLDDLARHMNEADALPTLDDVQTIQTFTIGFFTDSDLLLNAATGEVRPDPDADAIPGYFLADNVTALESAFDAIFAEIESDVATFTSPAVSVNSLNRLQNRDVLYFTMFEPSPMGQPHWDGNVKAYYLGRPGGAEDTTLAILDTFRDEALENDGTFRDGARSIWSAQDDGGIVTAGGFVSRLSDQRRVVSNLNGGNLLSPTNPLENPNAVRPENADITLDMLGIAVAPGPGGQDAADARREALLRFAQGLDENGNPLGFMGDPLHTQPLILTFASDSEDLAVFVSTNDGYLHRIDPTPIEGDVSGDLEEWAFIPKELLRNLDTIERNPPQLPNVAEKLYGLDGPLTALIQGDDNGVVDSNERVYLYSAMRRGGRSYYALDLGPGANSNTLSVAFQITGGDTGFERLGQTWSAATPARVDLGNGPRDVLIFGGGYDTAHDENYASGTLGNAVYIVDATTKDLLWRASGAAGGGADEQLVLPNMTYPIPSDVTVLDINQDGLVDRMYVGDLGGQVWRFDILGGEVTGGRFAALGDPAAATTQRRFFNAPSVTRILTRTDNFLAVAIGSGWRAHPLSRDNDDRLYVLKDPNVFTPQIDEFGNYPPALTEADLVEVDIGPGDGDDDIGGTQLQNTLGWFVDLAASGEKNLSRALIADNRVFFTTYSPDNNTLGCQPTAVAGTGRLYALDILSGLPALINANGETVAFVDLERNGIPPEPQLIFVEPPCVANCDNVDDDGNPIDPDEPLAEYATVNGTCRNPGSDVYLLAGLNGLPSGICTAPVPTYWTEADQPLGDL